MEQAWARLPASTRPEVEAAAGAHAPRAGVEAAAGVHAPRAGARAEPAAGERGRGGKEEGERRGGAGGRPCAGGSSWEGREERGNPNPRLMIP